MNIINLFKDRKNSADRFERTIRPHIEALYKLAFRLCNSQNDAEELVQVFLIRIFPKIDQLELIEKKSPWLCRGLYNLYVDNYRKTVREATIFDCHETDENLAQHQNTPLDYVDNKDLSRRINTALQQLNDDQRVVVLLHDSEGYTLHELTEILGVPLGTLKSRLNRARQSLKKLL